MEQIKLGKYEHFKGDIVEVFGNAFHSETLEGFVIYKHTTGKCAGEPYYWVRPLKMFTEEVEVNGQKLPRFRYIG
ncbi:MAG: Alpha amylase, catalytic domain protein [Candidatus Jorgensenbacteria bacterium GW2011_GWA1_48_13]|uniref:Alpha amylase, catalytic domain protein n=2 Tax=Candidatus Joergenseniibacteriota TaxID=1752739 RepID=A0A0G1W8M6_9BACT|nr:MAG: Alpha amylase, catalytic domain protein [Candidatus Jorgensenbacteria bacterium GW2011_GWA1_48_13]KKU99322.1 MAG: hypothetical protein UY32_C0002G0058 [Candidatus Jorgensenbacteria bacterium GW2011_GWC1_48_8]KKW15005.1 MAG: Alpha amylase, catalytic domain protein [Candidatus Jorgensenbacteria bacterium GW2011_GWB1_50_10]